MKKTLTTIIKLTKNKYIEKETGYMICENATLGSTGMQEYYAGELEIEDLPPNQRVKIYRPAEEVFKPESLASLENKAFTIYHPDVMLNSENDSQLRKGSVYNIHRSGDTIVGDIQITDKDAIEKSKKINKLSLGYSFDLEKMDGADYSYIARNIRYNHLALVPKGRSKVAQINDAAIDNENLGGEYMSLFKRNVSAFDADEEKKEEKEEEKVAKDECGSKTMDEETSAEKEKVEKRDEKEGAEEDTVTKEIEKRVAKGDYTQKDLEKLLEKLKKGKKEEIKEDYKERKEEEKKAKDGGEMTLSEIDAISDADVRKIALEEYKVKRMAEKGLIYGDDNNAFVKTQTPENKVQKTAMDEERERRAYYRNVLNPHKNKNYRDEFVSAYDVIDF